jgi:hypothetical protein
MYMLLVEKIGLEKISCNARFYALQNLCVICQKVLVYFNTKLASIN